MQQAEAAQAEAVRLVCEASEAELQKAFVAHDVVLSEREAELEEGMQAKTLKLQKTIPPRCDSYYTKNISSCQHGKTAKQNASTRRFLLH